ncbi:hypothetical protein BY996DRAFT_4582906 [Phakopsora pachyrhizi]|uniref:Uncharacterized protein n=1 Tax=Phakopsora pachyrhizi TaxID=170000 RepID=A0AAV0AST1_PHAPC|nr:hypothetical protein BY996DRAFT_4582906 [Phakopsora pachyrhizi]CAH7670659.1 hypothetical protein PPACK8108_LOCUS5378 [Phakopsora pachyrhizi]
MVITTATKDENSTRSYVDRFQHNRSNSLASRLSTTQRSQSPSSSSILSSTAQNLTSIQTSTDVGIGSSITTNCTPPMTKAFSAGPIIYPHQKTNFEAIRGRFGLDPSSPTTYSSNSSTSNRLSTLGSASHYRKQSYGNNASYRTTVGSAQNPSTPPVYSASSLMGGSTGSPALEKATLATRRRPLSVIEPYSTALNSGLQDLSLKIQENRQLLQLERVSENGTIDHQNQYQYRRGHSSNPPCIEADQLIPVGQAEDVVGLQGRIRLSKDLPRSPVINSSFNRGLKLLESQRHLLQAYEYLCHVGEAKDWLEAVLIINSLDEELQPQEQSSITSTIHKDFLNQLSVTEFEQTLRDGVILARLARRFIGPEGVPRIFVNPKLQYRHSDNINYFFRFVRSVGLPELFIFELVDLYNAKNLPKVIYCIHVLSHLLAKKGLAERIGNLVGKLEFSNDQLEQKNADLAGKAIPNFGNINKELAKEINEEPEVEVESESDRIFRELSELIPEIMGLQSQLRGCLARSDCTFLLENLNQNLPIFVALQAALRGALQRKRYGQLYRKLSVNVHSIVNFQALLRGIKCRRKCKAALELRRQLDSWATALQSAIRSKLVRRRFSRHLTMIEKLEFLWVALQAQVRGAIVRSRQTSVIHSAHDCERAFVGIQSMVRARLMTQNVQQQRKRLESVEISDSVVGLQARLRGLLSRRRFFEPIHRLDNHEPEMVKFQSLIRTRLVRSNLGRLVSELISTEEEATSFQAACRGFLSRKGLLGTVQELQANEPSVVNLQAACRAALIRKAHTQKTRALKKVEVTRGLGGLQAFVRAGLIRKKIVNQKKELDFIQPDVVGIQSQCRGYLARVEWGSWFEHVRNSVPAAIFLQSLTRGFLLRREFFEKLIHYHNNINKIVKVQSVYRARQQASQYRDLTSLTNVQISTVKAFLHLLDDSDLDYEEEIELARLRTEVVRSIRENQQLDSHVKELDTKIALLVKNKITLDEVQRASGGSKRKKDGVYRNSILAAANDPFASSNLLDKNSRKRLECYQRLFYLLQTRPEYLARLFYVIRVVGEDDEKVKKVLEGVVLTLFGYAQMRREEFLLLKLFQRSIHEELAGVNSLTEFLMGDFIFIKLLVQYGRGTKERRYLKDLLVPIMGQIVGEDCELNLETDPIKIYRSVISEEETRTGIQSSRPMDVTFNEALADQETLSLFIKHLQSLRALTDRFLYAITQSTRKMPFGLRYIGREIFRGLKVKFTNESEDGLAKVVLHMIYYRYLQPAIVAPETYDVVDSIISPLARKNLLEVSKMLNQISVGRLFSDENPYLVPLNEYLSHASGTFTTWFYSLIDVEDAEVHFEVDEYLDHVGSNKPTIYISPNEIYSTHALVQRDLDRIAPEDDDPLRVVMNELGGAPSAASAELDQARSGEIALHLESKLTVTQDPEADLKALWVKTKRYVLAMLKVQPEKSLLDAFLAPVTEEHEDEWSRIVMEEIEFERNRKQKISPSSSSSTDHHYNSRHTLEDVHQLTFQELKARTLENVLALEKRGKFSRDDCYQGILDSLAKDILQRNRRRIQRRVDMMMLVNTIGNLNDKHRYLEEQEAKYHSYISDSMASMQKKGFKKKFVMPFTPQWHHLRSLEKEGRKPRFGSYKYSAQRLYEKGILLSINQFSPKQFDKVSLIISCDEVGIFKIETRYLDSIVNNGTIELRMEDLLESQFAGKQSVNLEIAKLNLNLLLYLIKSVHTSLCL